MVRSGLSRGPERRARKRVERVGRRDRGEVLRNELPRVAGGGLLDPRTALRDGLIEVGRELGGEHLGVGLVREVFGERALLRLGVAADV